jgi:hypothetical protein
MGQRLILSEEEKKNIQKMYGLINEQLTQSDRTKYYDDLTKKISDKLIGKTLKFNDYENPNYGNVKILSYADRNEGVNLEKFNNEPISDFEILFNAKYNNYNGILTIKGEFENGVLSDKPILFIKTESEDIVPETDITWDMVGGYDLWSSASSPSL